MNYLQLAENFTAKCMAKSVSHLSRYRLRLGGWSTFMTAADSQCYIRLGLPPFHCPNPGQGSGGKAPSRRESGSITPRKLLELYM